MSYKMPIPGSVLSGNVPAGYVGEYIKTASGGVSYNATGFYNVASVSLGAGIWMCYGSVTATSTSGSSINGTAFISISTSSGAFDSASYANAMEVGAVQISVNDTTQGYTPYRILNVSAATTIYLVASFQKTDQTGSFTSNSYIATVRIA